MTTPTKQPAPQQTNWLLLGVGALVVITLLFGPLNVPRLGWDDVKGYAGQAKDGIRNLIAGPETAAPADVAALKVHPAGSLRGYSRTEFGPAWTDVDRNGCDTRNDILRRDLTLITTKAGTHDCVVIAGVLHDRYTGTIIQFQKATAGAVQIDHVVPLAAAWRAGARTWTTGQRTAFANDPGNLLAVDGPTNEAKGDSTPDEWMPPRHGEGCDYARRYVTVKARYHLSVTPAERDALSRALTGC